MPVTLRTPAPDLLPAYAAALQAGWSANTMRDTSKEQLAEIAADPDAFLASLHGRPGATIRLDDGRVVPRIPGPTLWIWDGTLCGSINLRHQPGTLALPPYVSGHVGYAVVPWKRRQGIATQALRLMLAVARTRGMSRVLITCDHDNLASRKVIEAACGVADGTEVGPHDETKLRYWVATLTPDAMRALPEAPDGEALAGLWWAARGEWDRAHECAQAGQGRDADWVHAYLHRVEGDAENAAYWYGRARQPVSTGDLDAEWRRIAAALLADQSPSDGVAGRSGG